jgi:hypothetical protein
MISAIRSTLAVVPTVAGRFHRPGLGLLLVGYGAVIAAAFGPLAVGGADRPPPNPRRAPGAAVTFSRDVAPILFQHCAPCHRPDQAAPFSLLSFADAQKRARQIAIVTAGRLMPPWLPEPGYGQFSGERRLTDRELEVLRQWADTGAAEGAAADLPAVPVFSEGWQLGTPDLVLKLPKPYPLAADGRDIYRNFVLPVSLREARFVRDVEFHPGNPKVVHHAFINVDETQQSRRLAVGTSPPSFEGMDLPDTVLMPGGQLLGWQPGKMVSRGPERLGWRLKPPTDVVLQMHLHPSGKPEVVDPAIALYFTDQPPTNVAFRIKLAKFDFEIPAGVSNHVVEQSYQLPTDVSVLRILPHAHYLGKDLQSFALLPSGEKRWLLWIKNWDFNWQGDYRYAEPVVLPRGARVVMRYTYDNSTNNVRNPHQPPIPVRHGLQTTDEMAGLVLQAIAPGPEQRAVLARDYFEYFVGVSAAYYAFRIQRDPKDAEAHTRLGRVLAARGQSREALGHLRTAVALKPDDDKAHYELGYLFLLGGLHAEAAQEFLEVIRLNPTDFQAYGNLGLIRLREGKDAEAQQYLETALRLNPDDAVARNNLNRLKNLR